MPTRLVRRLKRQAQRSRAAARIKFPTALDVLQELGNTSVIHNELDFMQQVAQQMLQIEPFDFFGVALKNKHDVFVVTLTEGEQVHPLL